MKRDAEQGSSKVDVDGTAHVTRVVPPPRSRGTS